jgi:hypothetical protein
MIIGLVSIIVTQNIFVGQYTNTSNTSPLQFYVISDDDKLPFSLEIKYLGPLNPKEWENGNAIHLPNNKLIRFLWYDIRINVTFDYEEDMLARLKIVFEAIADPLPQLEYEDIETLIKAPGYSSPTPLANWGFYSENTKALSGESLEWKYTEKSKSKVQKYKLKFRIMPSFPGDSLQIYFQMEGIHDLMDNSRNIEQ